MQLFQDRGQRPPPSKMRLSQGELRLQKDLDELSFSRLSVGTTGVRIHFPNHYVDGKKSNFVCSISPQEGFYRGGTFDFQFCVSSSYPFSPPDVTCTTQVFHPNINLNNGEINLPLLTKDWKPIWSINTVVYGLQLLFVEPNLDNVANEECAALLRTGSRERFDQAVQQTLDGGTLNGVNWHRNRLGETLV